MSERTGETVLLVEDDRAMARIVSAALRARGYKVVVAGAGLAALGAAERDNPAVVLLDLGLPDIDGIEVCRQLRSWSTVPIIVVSADGADDRKVTALDQGADDYVTKPFSTEELLARVRARLRERVPQGNVIEYRDVVMDRDRHEVHRAGKPISLTAKEYALLEYLLLHRNKVHTRDELFNGVWGSDFLGDSNLIDVYIRYLRGKIDDGFDDKLITTVRGVGYTIKD